MKFALSKISFEVCCDTAAYTYDYDRLNCSDSSSRVVPLPHLDELQRPLDIPGLGAGADRGAIADDVHVDTAAPHLVR